MTRQKNRLPEGTIPSFEHSKLEGGQYKLRCSSDRLIASVTLHDARSMLAYRREVARKILDRAKVFINSENPGNQQKRLIRIQTWSSAPWPGRLALAAASPSLPMPKRSHG